MGPDDHFPLGHVPVSARNRGSCIHQLGLDIRFDEYNSYGEYRIALRAFASMRAVHLFLRAREVINFLMRAASTLEITYGEQRALPKFSVSWNLVFLKRFAPSNLANTFKTGQRAQS